MFHITKSTNSHYIVFQIFKNNGAITVQSQNSDCCLYDATLVTHCCFWREPHLVVSAVNARSEILALTAQGYFNVIYKHIKIL